MKNKSLFIPLFLSLFFVSLLLHACAETPQIDITITPTESITMVSNQRTCPEQIEINQVEYQNDPMLVIILIENSKKSESNIPDVLNQIKELAQLGFKPGDRLLVALMGSIKLEDAVILDTRVDRVATPDITPPPIKPLITIEINDLYSGFEVNDNEQDEDIPFLVKTKQARDADSELQETQKMLVLTQEAGYKQATATVNEYNCKYEEWKAEYNTTIAAWNEEKQVAIKKFAQNVEENLDNAVINTYLDEVYIYEALSNATSLFHNECTSDKFTNCSLIIFSNSHDWRKKPPEDLYINFSNINALLVISKCKYTFQDSCKPLVEFWQNNLTSFGIEHFKLTNEWDTHNYTTFLGR